MCEMWRDVVDDENYIVSNTGRIRRKGTSIDKSLRISKDGYHITHLYHDGIRQCKRVHRVVAEAFIDNPKNKPEVNHKNGNKLDNRVENLEWNTSQENVRHAWTNNLMKPSYSMLGKHNPNGGRKGIPFKIVETGETFDTMASCAKAIGGSQSQLTERVVSLIFITTFNRVNERRVAREMVCHPATMPSSQHVPPYTFLLLPFL